MLLEKHNFMSWSAQATVYLPPDVHLLSAQWASQEIASTSFRRAGMYLPNTDGMSGGGGSLREPCASLSHHPSPSPCFSSSFPSVSVQLYTLFSRRDWWRKRLKYLRKKLAHVGFHLWAVELADAMEKKEFFEFSGSYSSFLLQSSSTSI